MERYAGVLVPLFALREDADFGCGDVAALRHFIDWAVGHGFRLVQLLPVNETGGDNSPYNAISSVALDPTTIAPHEIKDLQPEEIASIAGQHRVAVRYTASLMKTKEDSSVCLLRFPA